MSDIFAFPKLYDENLADGGEWFPVLDENGKSWGEYRCRLIDNTVPHHKIALERLNRQYNQAAKRGVVKTEEDKILDLFLEISLVSWRKVPGVDGDVPYSRENAELLFKSRYGPFVFQALLAKCTDKNNFASEAQEEAGDAEKN